MALWILLVLVTNMPESPYGGCLELRDVNIISGLTDTNRMGPY